MYVYMCVCMHLFTSLIFDCDPFFNGTDNIHQIKCIASICTPQELLQWIDTYNIKITNPEIEVYLRGKGVPTGGTLSSGGLSTGDHNRGIISTTGVTSSKGATSRITSTRGVSLRNRAVVKGIHSKGGSSGSKSRANALRRGEPIGTISMGGLSSEGSSIGDLSAEGGSSSDGAPSRGASSEGAFSKGAPSGGTKWHAFRTAANAHLCCEEAIDLVEKMLTIDHQVTPLD